MKITQWMLSQCIRLITADSAQTLSRPQLLTVFRRFEERYGFLQGPGVIADYNIETGITFLEGQFKDIYISKFILRSNGVLAEAITTTDRIDEFLDDVIIWASTEFGHNLEEPTRRRSYLSQFETQLDISFSSAFDQFSAFGKGVAEKLRSYGQNTYDFEVTEFRLHCDIADLPIPKPGPAFALSRREGKPYKDEIYFASAPMRTADHIQALEELQKLLVPPPA